MEDLHALVLKPMHIVLVFIHICKSSYERIQNRMWYRFIKFKNKKRPG